MPDDQVTNYVLQQFNLRIGPKMSEYVTRKFQAGGDIPIIGGDARTGVPRRQIIPATALGKIVK